MPIQIKNRIERFVVRQGRRPRVLVGNLDQRGPARESKLLASILAEAGFDVDISPPNQSPGGIARMAVENDVHGICAVSTINNHLGRVAELADALKAEDAENIKILVYGTMPEIDREFVYGAGAAQIIDSGQFNQAAVSRLLDMFE